MSLTTLTELDLTPITFYQSVPETTKNVSDGCQPLITFLQWCQTVVNCNVVIWGFIKDPKQPFSQKL